MSCYSRNGTLWKERGSIPCNTTAVAENKHSSCCAVGDLCLTNGMCRSQEDEQHAGNQYFRVGCTDPTWKDPSCANYCEGKETGTMLSARIFNCLSSKSWCCSLPTTSNTNQVNMACCSNQDYTFEAPDPLVFTTANFSTPRTPTTQSVQSSSQTPLPSSSSSSLTSSSAPSSTQPASQSDSAQATSQPAPDNTGLKVGLGVGLTLGILLIAALVALVLLLRRRKQNDRGDRYGMQELRNDPTPNEPRSEMHTDVYPADVKGPKPPIQYYAHHAPTKNEVVPQHFELGSSEPVEMPASPYAKGFEKK